MATSTFFQEGYHPQVVQKPKVLSPRELASSLEDIHMIMFGLKKSMKV